MCHVYSIKYTICWTRKRKFIFKNICIYMSICSVYNVYVCVYCVYCVFNVCVVYVWCSVCVCGECVQCLCVQQKREVFPSFSLLLKWKQWFSGLNTEFKKQLKCTLKIYSSHIFHNLFANFSLLENTMLSVNTFLLKKIWDLELLISWKYISTKRMDCGES